MRAPCSTGGSHAAPGSSALGAGPPGHPDGPDTVIVSPALPCPPGGGGRPTVEMTGDRVPLRKVPTPEVTGAGLSPPGESPSSGAETTQPGGTRKASRRRIPLDMVKRPTSREQALRDGRSRPRDRRGERGVECRLKQNGAYYRHLARPSSDRRPAFSSPPNARPRSPCGKRRARPGSGRRGPSAP